MGLQEAKKYISELNRKQGKLELWPDFLTGLPDKAATVRQAGKAAGKQAVVYIRIADVEPFIVKYGATHHAEVVQWAAAILKTTAERYQGFVGVYDTHDFIAVVKKKDAPVFIEEATSLFAKKAASFYSEEDRKRKAAISFDDAKRHVDVGLMRFVHAISLDAKPATPDQLIPDLARKARKAEKGI